MNNRKLFSPKKVYLYPEPVDFRKSIDGLAAWSIWTSRSRCLPNVIRVPPQAPKPSKYFVLGAQWFLPLAKAGGVRTPQNIARLFLNWSQPANLVHGCKPAVRQSTRDPFFTTRSYAIHEPHL